MLALKILWLFLNILQMRIMLINCENTNNTFIQISKFKRSLQPISNDSQNNLKLATFEEMENSTTENYKLFEKLLSEIDYDLFTESATDVDSFVVPEVIDNDGYVEDPFDLVNFQSGESNGDLTTVRSDLTFSENNILQIWLNEAKQKDTLEKNLLNDDATLDLGYLEENENFFKSNEKLREEIVNQSRIGAVANVTKIPDVDEEINFESNGQILNFTVLNGSLDASSSTISAYAEQTTTNLYQNHQLVSNGHFFGAARDRNDLSCISLNLTLNIEYKNVPLNLDTNTLIDGGCDPFDAFVEFKWTDIENFGNLSANFGVICEEKLCYVNDVFVKLKFTNGTKLYVQKKMKIFASKPSLVYENSTLIILEMGKGVEIKLSNVEFFVSSSISEGRAVVVDLSQISEYYSKLFGSIVGLLLLIIFTIYLVYFVRRWRKSKGEKKDLTTT